MHQRSAQAESITVPQAIFVEEIYYHVLHRSASDGEIANVERAIQSVGRTSVVDWIARSPEARNVMVSTWYQRFLGRSPGAGEPTFWANAL